MEKYMVSLAPEERVELQQLVKAGKAAARRLAHARVLLLADRDECPDDEIIAALGLSLRTVERVRKRLVTEGLDAALDHRPQPPRPDKIKIRGDLEQQLIELACADPPPGRCRWTLRLLADEMVVLGLVHALSTETVRQALKKMRIIRLTRRRPIEKGTGVGTRAAAIGCNDNGKWKRGVPRQEGR